MFKLKSSMFAFVGLALTLASSQAFATPQQLRGQVLDEELGDPIPGVEVRVEGQSAVAITDPEGRFRIDVERWPATLIAQDPMIESTRVKLEGTADAVVIRAPYLEDNSLMVVAERVTPLTASTRSINAREFQAVPRRTAEDALQLIPGFTLVQHGSEGKGHQFFLRGFDAIHGSDLELKVEGVGINEWSNIHAQGYLDVAFVIPETVESVEVTKGPFTLNQGAFAMAGSANYKLGIAPDARGLRAGYTFGTTFRHRGVLTYSPKERDGEDFVAVELLSDRGFGQNRGVGRASFLGRWRLLRSARAGDLRLMASAYTAKFELPGTLKYKDFQAGKVGFFDAQDKGAHGRSERALLSLEHRWKAGPHELRTQLYGMGRRLFLLENYTGFFVDPVHGDRRQQAQTAISTSFSASYRYQATEALTLVAGVGALGDWIDQSQEHVDMGRVRVKQERNLRVFQSIAHLQVGLRYRFKNRLWISGGVRGDLVNLRTHDRLEQDPDFRNNKGQRGVLSPRFTAEYKISTPLRVFAAYGRGFRPPEARSYSSFVPGKKGIDENLAVSGKPRNVQDDAVELGLRWMHSRYFATSSALFGTFVQNETIFDHVSGVNLQLDGTRRLGGELEVHSHPLDGLSLSADLTYVDARFAKSGQRVPLAPWLSGGARAVYTHQRGFRAGLYLMALAPRPLPHNARGGTLASLDATFGYSWKWLRFDLELENVLNNKIREGEYHYASHWAQGQTPSALPVVHFVAGAPINARFTVAGVF